MSANREPLRGNVTSGIEGLLVALGVSTTAARDGVEETVTALLTERGLRARMVQLRWGTVLLETDPQTARLLDFELDVMTRELRSRFPGEVETVRVRVAR